MLKGIFSSLLAPALRRHDDATRATANDATGGPDGFAWVESLCAEGRFAEALKRLRALGAPQAQAVRVQSAHILSRWGRTREASRAALDALDHGVDDPAVRAEMATLCLAAGLHDM